MYEVWKYLKSLISALNEATEAAEWLLRHSEIHHHNIALEK